MAGRRTVEDAAEPGVYARRIGSLDAFLIVVAPHARGRGLARRLYADLFDLARRAGHELVVCEVNINPPNPGSDALHATLGFAEVGQATIRDGSKTVRYLGRALGIRSGQNF